MPPKAKPSSPKDVAHGGKLGGISIHDQNKWPRRQQPKQSNATTRRLAGYVLANPPFNDSDWFRKDDVDCVVVLN